MIKLFIEGGTVHLRNSGETGSNVAPESFTSLDIFRRRPCQWVLYQNLRISQYH